MNSFKNLGVFHSQAVWGIYATLKNDPSPRAQADVSLDLFTFSIRLHMAATPGRGVWQGREEACGRGQLGGARLGEVRMVGERSSDSRRTRVGTDDAPISKLWSSLHSSHFVLTNLYRFEGACFFTHTFRIASI